MTNYRNKELTKFTDAARSTGSARLKVLQEHLFTLENERDNLEQSLRDCRDAIYAEETALRLGALGRPAVAEVRFNPKERLELDHESFIGTDSSEAPQGEDTEQKSSAA